MGASIIANQAALEDLIALILSGEEFGDKYKKLVDNERQFVKSTLSIVLPGVIKDHDDDRWSLDTMPEEPDNNKWALLVDVLDNKLSVLFDNGTQFGKAFGALGSKDQRAVLYESCKNDLPGMIHTAMHFHWAYAALSNGTAFVMGQRYPYTVTAVSGVKPDHRAELFEAVKDKLPGLIKSADDFKFVVCNLTPEQHNFVYAQVKDRLPEMVKSAESLTDTLRRVSTEQGAALCNVLAESRQLHILFPTGKTLKKFLFIMSAEQQTMLCTLLEPHLQQLLKTAGNDQAELATMIANAMPQAAIEQLLPAFVKENNHVVVDALMSQGAKYQPQDKPAFTWRRAGIILATAVLNIFTLGWFALRKRKQLFTDEAPQATKAVPDADDSATAALKPSTCGFDMLYRYQVEYATLGTQPTDRQLLNAGVEGVLLKETRAKFGIK